MEKLRDFMFEACYIGPSKQEEEKTGCLIEQLYCYFKAFPNAAAAGQQRAAGNVGPANAVTLPA